MTAMFMIAAPSATAFEATPGTEATWSFASHKPLMQTLDSRQGGQIGRVGAGPVPDANDANDVSDARQLDRGVIDNAQRRVEAVAASGAAGTPSPPSPTVSTTIELALQPSDGRVSQAVRRYAERNGWQLAWEIERDFPIEYPATFRGDFLGIVEQIVRSLQNTDAPIRVKVYEANRVLRVVHATQ
ncbi:toxin co-regulated pilus biosynthesis Q family protein [Pandoraea aquatica]|nr:toxin co-regulated pilus biosynthesis Q family protein [Pandoraea aquatica]